METELTLIERLWLAFMSLFWLGLWLFSLMLLFLYPVRRWTGDWFPLVRLLNYVLPWMLIFLLPAMVLAGFSGQRWLVLSLVSAAILIGLNFAILYWPRHAPAPAPDAFTVKIMSHNLFSRADPQLIAETMRQEGITIILFQEAAHIPQAVWQELNQPADPWYMDQADTQAIISRYPIIERAVAWDRGRTQKVVLETPAGPVAVWNVHLWPPVMYEIARHDEGAAGLVADIAAMAGPLIVAGDFNATDQTATYHMVNRHLSEAHRQVGYGLGLSYPAPPLSFNNFPIVTGLMLRIDHIFYSDHFVVHQAVTWPHSVGSDHLPVMAQLSFKP